MKILKQLGVLFVAVWLLVGPIAAAYAASTQTVYVRVTWIMPDLHDDWHPGYGGQTIQVKVETVGAGIDTFFAYATIDYELSNVSCVMDISGLQGNYHWGLVTRIPKQIIQDGQGHVAFIERPPLQSTYRANDGFNPLVQLGNVMLNGSYE